MAGVDYVPEAALQGHGLQVVASPYFSLFMALRDAVGAERSGTPEGWRTAIRKHLTRRDYEVIAPLAISSRAHAPDAILPFPQAPRETFEDGLEQIVAAEHHLVRDIELCLAAGPTGDWRQAARDPQLWLRRFILASARAWRGFRPVWQESQRRLGAEIERVAVATERGAQLDVVGDLLPHGWIADGCWQIERCDDVRVPLPVADPGLTLIPLVAGPRASILHRDDAGLRHVGYPLRLAPPRQPGPAPDPASLEALIGVPRARILWALDRPNTNSGIAALLHTVPSAASYHLSALEAAGLVSRHRSGRSQIVRRTPRGDALLALYES